MCSLVMYWRIRTDEVHVPRVPHRSTVQPNANNPSMHPVVCASDLSARELGAERNDASIFLVLSTAVE